MMTRWYEKPLRIADLGAMPWKFETVQEAVKMVERKKNLHFNAEHFCAFEYEGGERGMFYFASSVADRVPLDLLGPYLAEAHRAGIKVLIYFNVHWFSLDFGRRHPDWVQLKRDGTPISDIYGLGMSPCVNSPGYRAWAFQVIRDLARYEIDGIFLDGPVFQPGTCYCTACRDKFRASFGRELPAWEDWEDQGWRDFIEFRYQSIAEFMRDSRAALKEIRPEAIIYMNGQGLWPGWPGGRDNRRLAEYQDLIGAEGGFIYGDLRQEALWKPAMSAKLLETQAAGKPTVVFMAGKNCAWNHYLLTPMETELLYADTIAHGASPWYGIFYENSTGEGTQAAGRMNELIERSSEYLERTSSIAKIGLMWSVRTADFYRATIPLTDFTWSAKKSTEQVKVGDHFKGFSGYFEALTRRHLIFDVLDEQAIEEKIGNYQVLILPNVACMSDAVARRIAAWVRDGGTLIATFETSCYDEWGNRREKPALEEILGCQFRGIEGPCNIDYFDRGVGPLFDGIDAPYIPSPRFRSLVTTTTGQALAFYRGKFPAAYQPMPALSQNPAVVENVAGKGKVIYFCGNIEESYFEYHLPEHEHLMTVPVSRASTPLLETDAPSSVEISLRVQREQGRLIVHLVNFTGEMTRPFQRVIPLSDITIRLPWVKNARRAFTLRERKELEWKVEPGFETRISLPGSYDAIVIEGVGSS